MSSHTPAPPTWQNDPQFTGPVWNVVQELLGLIFTMVGMGNVSAEPKLEGIRQRAWIRNPGAIPGVFELTSMYQRGGMTEEDFHEGLKRNGFDPAWAPIWLQFTRQFPTLEQCLELHRRGEMTTERMQTLLGRLGYQNPDRAALAKLSRRLPVVTDLLQWLVREVFDPAKRSQLQLDDQFPDAALPYFRQLGFDDEYARNTWAAHWRLPSVTQGYSMFHRGEIDREDLNALMTANDYLPKYRDALIAVAYNTLTRVDVRRMHALGVLDREGIVKAYLDLGYSPDNAELMAQFTERYNARSSSRQDNAEGRELSRSQVLRLYREGRLPGDQAAQRLAELGYNRENAALLLDAEHGKVLDEYKRMELETLRHEYRQGLLTEGQANQILASMELPHIEHALQQARLRNARRQERKTLTLAQTTKMYQQSLLDGDAYMERLEKMGYDHEDILLLVQSEGPAAGTDYLATHNLSRLREGYKEGTVLRGELYRFITRLGFGPIGAETLYRQIYATNPNPEEKQGV